MPGNRSKLTPEFIAEMSRYVSGGLTNKDACALCGVSQTAFYRWIQEPRKGLEIQLWEAIEKARVRRKAMLIQTITNASKTGQWQAAAWYLERQYPQEFAKPDRYHDAGIDEAVKAVKELTESIKAQADAADR